MLIGLVGKPSAGKSTFFKAATLAEVDIGPYPFVTIKPNSGVAYVRVECVDKEFGVQCNPRKGYCIDNNRFVPMELLDVAGLVPGAHEGKGMGNKFLDDLRQADVLIHVIDASGSTNEKGELVTVGSHDPMIDVRFLEIELDMWYLSILKKGWDKFARQTQQEKNEIRSALAKQLSGLKVTEDLVEDAINLLGLSKLPVSWTVDELQKLATVLRRKTKPIILACNKVDLPSGKENYERIRRECNDYLVISCSAESELALREAAKKELISYIPGESKFSLKKEEELTEQQKKALEFIRERILKMFGSTGVQQALNAAVFDVYKAIAVFPGGASKLEDKDGNVLPDCFLLKKESTALDFAYHIHTDIGNKFVKAIDVKRKVAVGRDYILSHRDVIEIKTS